jgi:hypothetical protein
MACLLARQPASPPDDVTASLTDCQIASTSCFNHIAKALQLLCNLCDSAAQNRALRAEVLLSQEFVVEVVDAVNLVMVAMAGPEAQRFLGAAQAQSTMQVSNQPPIAFACVTCVVALPACVIEATPGAKRSIRPGDFVWHWLHHSCPCQLWLLSCILPRCIAGGWPACHLPCLQRSRKWQRPAHALFHAACPAWRTPPSCNWQALVQPGCPWTAHPPRTGPTSQSSSLQPLGWLQL